MGLIYPSSFQTNQSAAGSFSDWKNLSYLALVIYSYKDKYIVDLSFRNDGSSRFAADYRFGNFWSAGVAWNVSNENFLADNAVINNLKFRASYGESGNNAIGLNRYSPVASSDYAVGVNHTLGVMGSAKYASGLNLSDYYKKISIFSLTKKGIEVIC